MRKLYNIDTSGATAKAFWALLSNRFAMIDKKYHIFVYKTLISITYRWLDNFNNGYRLILLYLSRVFQSHSGKAYGVSAYKVLATVNGLW